MGTLNRIAKALSQVRSPSQSLVKLGEAMKMGFWCGRIDAMLNEVLYKSSPYTPNITSAKAPRFIYFDEFTLNRMREYYDDCY